MTSSKPVNPQIRWTVPDFRRVAATALHAQPLAPEQAATGPSDFDLNQDVAAPLLATLRPAAVLVPVVARDTMSLLLTERTDHLPAHAGQIAFPGGKIDSGETAHAAALREAHEEIGLESRFIEPLGYLAPYRTGTGFLVTPLVALVQPGFTLTRNEAEVADIFEVPLSHILDPTNLRIDSRLWRGAERRYYAIPYQHRYIWGATAGIIKALHRSFQNQ